MGFQGFGFAGKPRPRKPGSPSAIASSARQKTSPSVDCPAQAVLGCVENVLAGVDKASRLGDSENGRELASGGVSLYWTWVSRTKQVGGRKRVSQEVGILIFRMVAENPTWGAPRIHGELLKLGFDLSERSVSRWGSTSSERSRSETQTTFPTDCDIRLF